MKKVTKVKKNWFKVQFEKHPYLFTFVIGWPILFFIIDDFIDPNFSDPVVIPFAIFFLLFPPIIFFLWFRKNKSKIKPFYKRNKKIFNRIYFYLGGVFSLIPIACIVGIIATGGVSNFIERAKFEYLVLKNLNEDPLFCQRAGEFMLNTPWSHYLFKEATQFLDYYDDGDVSRVIKKVIRLKDDSLFNFNHCAAERLLLKAAQKGDVDAQEMLVSMPLKFNYFLEKKYFKPKNPTLENSYIFGRYFKKIKEMNLENPALAYTYGYFVLGTMGAPDDIKDENNKEGIDYLVQSAEAGYLRAMLDYVDVVSYDDKFVMSNCEKILRYSNYLAEQKELLTYISVMDANMGYINSFNSSKRIYKCLDNKPNFSKSFSMIKSFEKITKKSSPWPYKQALFYLNGWGDVNQNYEKAYELFNNYQNAFASTASVPGYLSQAYLAYMNFKGIGVEQNPNKGKGLTIELVKEIDLTEIEKDSFNIELLCDGVNYNFVINDPENEYRNKMGQCLLDSKPEVSIEFLEDFIKILMTDRFHPELFETINYLGEAK